MKYTYKELVQWAWDEGLLKLGSDWSLFAYAAGLATCDDETHRAFGALEAIGIEAGVWIPYDRAAAGS